MQIHVTTLLGKKFDVEIDGSGTLRALKCKVEDMEAIHSDWQTFVFDRFELLDDDGLVVDQVNEILRRNQGDPIGGDSCISLWLFLRSRGGGNLIYHKPVRIQQGSSASSDSESDDGELPRNRQNEAFGRPDQIECSSSSDQSLDELSRNGSPESAAPSGADTNGPEQNTSETRVKGLSDSLKPSQENGIRRELCASNIFPEKEHRFWMFLSGAGISINFVLLMMAAAVFLAPKAMREIPQISRMLQSEVGKHDGIEGILKTVSDTAVEHGGSIAHSAALLVVVSAFLLLAIRHCGRSPMFQSFRQEKQDFYLEVLRDGERVKVSVSNIVVGDIVLSDKSGRRYADSCTEK